MGGSVNDSGDPMSSTGRVRLESFPEEKNSFLSTRLLSPSVRCLSVHLFPYHLPRALRLFPPRHSTRQWRRKSAQNSALQLQDLGKGMPRPPLANGMIIPMSPTESSAQRSGVQGSERVLSKEPGATEGQLWADAEPVQQGWAATNNHRSQ